LITAFTGAIKPIQRVPENIRDGILIFFAGIALFISLPNGCAS
jgi:hypothetical protein